VWYGIDAAIGRSLGGQLVSVLAALALGAAAYLRVARALGLEEVAVLASLRRRAGAGSAGAVS
jgi:hypothetical protein